jgi:RNA polymerase sigma-70 factor (ECF subfamily)
MIGVARRKIADHLRRKRPPAEPTLAEGSYVFAASSDEKAVVDAVLASLQEDHREVLILKYFVGLSSEEIGSLLDRRASAIDSLLQRARAAFGEEWGRATDEEVDW